MRHKTFFVHKTKNEKKDIKQNFLSNQDRHLLFWYHEGDICAYQQMYTWLQSRSLSCLTTAIDSPMLRGLSTVTRKTLCKFVSSMITNWYGPLVINLSKFYG